MTAKKILLGVATAVVIGSMVIVGVVLAVVLTRQTGECSIRCVQEIFHYVFSKMPLITGLFSCIDTTTASTSSTTTVAPMVLSVYWSFENTPNDLNNTYNGSLNNDATYSTAGSTSFPYFGATQSLLLNGTSQFLWVSSPIFPLNFTSFTIEAWIYPSSLSSDRGIFAQCHCRGCTNQCLYFITRGNRLHIGFTSNDLTGSTILIINTWYHVAFVYNYQTQQQILYVNGVQDAIKSNAAPYQGTNGSVLIGSAQIFTNTYFFNGHIDNLAVITRAKSANEVLDDASLIAYYPFDWPSPSADKGPNGVLGSWSNMVTVTGRINQGIRLIGSTSSWFRINSLYQLPRGVVANRPFSLSLWINPTSSISSTFVQLFSTTTAACDNFLGLYSFTGSNAQVFVQSVNNAPPQLIGPFVPQNAWTHISVTFSTTNGYILYFNGVYFGTTGSTTYAASSSFANLFIGYTASCTGAGQNGVYQGSIDEVYVHNRELTQADVTKLANP